MHTLPGTNKRLPLILLVTSLLLSRAVFFFFDDPEGPNLLIVAVVAAMLYVPSLVVYHMESLRTDSKRLWSALLTQVLLIVVLYVLGVTF